MIFPHLNLPSPSVPTPQAKAQNCVDAHRLKPLYTFNLSIAINGRIGVSYSGSCTAAGSLQLIRPLTMEQG